MPESLGNESALRPCLLPQPLCFYSPSFPPKLLSQPAGPFQKLNLVVLAGYQPTIARGTQYRGTAEPGLVGRKTHRSAVIWTLWKSALSPKSPGGSYRS